MNTITFDLPSLSNPSVKIKPCCSIRGRSLHKVLIGISLAADRSARRIELGVLASVSRMRYSWLISEL